MLEKGDEKKVNIILDLKHAVCQIQNEGDSTTMASRLSLVEYQITVIREPLEARKIEYKHVLEEMLPSMRREQKTTRGIINAQLEELRVLVRERRTPILIPETQDSQRMNRDIDNLRHTLTQVTTYLHTKHERFEFQKKEDERWKKCAGGWMQNMNDETLTRVTAQHATTVTIEGNLGSTISCVNR